MNTTYTCGTDYLVLRPILTRRWATFSARFAIAISLGMTGVAQAQSSSQKGPIDFSANIQSEAARIVNEPQRWSTLRVALEVGATAKFGNDVRARVVGQLATNAAASAESNYYPFAVRKDQRLNASVREAFVEMPLGNFNARIGKQYINWGEAVGVFVADVVNARDLREFLLPDLDQVRIGQWAARVDWQGEDKSAEVVWIPVPLYDRIGAFGGDYYPIAYSTTTQSLRVGERVKPSSSLRNSNVGVRGGFLKDGWDVAAFFYRSMDRETVFANTLSALGPTLTPVVGNRISQFGYTLSKDVEFAVFKSEGVFTQDKALANLALTPEGFAKRNTVDWLVGLDVPLPDSEARVNLQMIQRFVLNHQPSLAVPKNQSYGSVQLTYPSGNWELSLLAIAGLNQSEHLIRPKVTYKATKNTRIALGADFFGGNAASLLGQFDSKDRVYLRVKHSF
jgi:hypothetical protein